MEQLGANLRPAASNLHLTAVASRGSSGAIRTALHSAQGITASASRRSGRRRYFDLQVQAGRSLGKRDDGLGIGLAAAYGLVEFRGGTLEARNDGPNAGSKFIVSPPLFPAGVHEAPVQAAASVAPEPR